MYTNDLVKRLRAYGGPGLSATKACLLAADEIDRLRAALIDINSISSAPSANHYHGLLSAQAIARAALSTTPDIGQAEGTAQPEAGQGAAETGPRYPSRTGDGEADAPAICDECGKYPADPRHGSVRGVKPTETTPLSTETQRRA